MIRIIILLAAIIFREFRPSGALCEEAAAQPITIFIAELDKAV